VFLSISVWVLGRFMITSSMETGVSSFLVVSKVSGPNFEASYEMVEQLPGTRDREEALSVDSTDKGAFFNGGAIDLLRNDLVTSFLGTLEVLFLYLLAQKTTEFVYLVGIVTN